MGRFKGYILAAFAAAAYGTNPAFAIPLYETGMNPNSVLLFRYCIGIPLLACLMTVRRLDFHLKKNELIPVTALGILMALSSLTLFESYNYMNSGVASTLLFVYPIMVAVIMTFFFKERIKASLIVCFVFMGAGLWFLMRPD
ncbi:MAG: DMT family transporter, partial [Muribaculaceae bacterium]|nr:DMT family transporter [Muribaculaceae bacterium]